MITQRPRVSVVTVNYNHGTYLKNYVESLRNSHYPIDEIIIVDNASTDDSIQILQAFSEVSILQNVTNIGYSAALNQAITHARSPLVCATGPDIVCKPDWLLPLVEQYLSDPVRIFAVASHVLSLDQTEVQSAGGSLHFSGHLCVYGMWEQATQHKLWVDAGEVGAIDSTSVLFDRAKYLTIGGCDTDFFVYHEEFDYCYRARMRGWSCWYHPKSVVFHGDGSHDYSVRSRGQYPRMRPYLHTKNRLLSLLKNYQLRTLLAIMPLMLLLELANLAMLLSLGLGGAYRDALLWLWAHRSSILKKRRAIQSTRRYSDRFLLQADPLTITPMVIHHGVLRTIKTIGEAAMRFYWRALSEVIY